MSIQSEKAAREFKKEFLQVKQELTDLLKNLDRYKNDYVKNPTWTFGEIIQVKNDLHDLNAMFKNFDKELE